MRKIASLSTGTPIGGKYRPIRILGAGGMAEVYEAEHVFTRRRVALKLIQGNLARCAPGTEDRFFAEAEAAAGITHPSIVDVLDAGREKDGTLYLAFELLAGQDLETAIQRGVLRPADYVRVGVRVLEALAATHASGLVHRDIKPANIFLARSAFGSVQVKLLDFGIARRIDPETGRTPPNPGSVEGTVEYMSPEQAGGEPLDGRADLWSVAAVLFRGLSGRTPFDSHGFHRTLLSIATERPPSLGALRSDLPSDLVQVIDRSLAPNRDDRWSTAEDMAHALALCEHPRLHGVENDTETADLESPGPHSEPDSALAPSRPPQLTSVRVDATTAKYAVVPFAAASEPLPPAAHPPTLIIRDRPFI